MTDLDWIVNNPQIRCDASTQEQIKSCRLHPERKILETLGILHWHRNIEAPIITCTSQSVGSFDQRSWHQGPCMKKSQSSSFCFLSVFRSILVFVFTFCPVEKCVCGPAVGNVWTRAPASSPSKFDFAPCPAAGWPEGPTSGRTSNWTNGCPGSPAMRTRTRRR